MGLFTSTSALIYLIGFSIIGSDMDEQQLIQEEEKKYILSDRKELGEEVIMLVIDWCKPIIKQYKQ